MKVENGANVHGGATVPSSRNELETYRNALRTVRECFCGKCKGVKDSSKGLTGLIYCSFCFLQNDHFGAYVLCVCHVLVKVDCFPSSLSTVV